MARTNRKTKPRPQARKSARPAAATAGRLPVFVFGLVSGLAVALALTLLGAWPGPATPDVATPTAQQAAAEPPAGVRFEFADMLRESETLVPYVEEYLQPEQPAPEDNIEYLLQAGAFRSADDADRRRAAILLLDLQARTLKVSREGASWHRVLVGPFASRDRVRSAQLQLLEEEIDSIVLRAGGE